MRRGNDADRLPPTEQSTEENFGLIVFTVVKDYGIGFILVVAGIFMAILNNTDKSKAEILKTVFNENKEFSAKLNIMDKEKFEQILQSMISNKNKKQLDLI